MRDAIAQNRDAQGRVVMRYDDDVPRNRINQASMEAGEQRLDLYYHRAGPRWKICRWRNWYVGGRKMTYAKALEPSKRVTDA